MKTLFLVIVAILPALLNGWVALPFARKVKIRVELGANWYREAIKSLVWPMVLTTLWCLVVGWFFIGRDFLWNILQLPPPPTELLVLEDALAVYVSLVAMTAAMGASMIARFFVERMLSARSQQVQ